jgi:hypothetical protein
MESTMTVQLQGQRSRRHDALCGVELLNDCARNKETVFTREERRLEVLRRPGPIARMGLPAEPNGLLAHALAGLRMWQEAFVEAQQMRRGLSKRYPFIDS